MIGLTMMVSLVRGSNLVDVDEVDDDFFLLLLLLLDEEFWVEVVVVDRRERTGRVGVVVVVVVVVVGDDGGGCTSLFACIDYRSISVLLCFVIKIKATRCGFYSSPIKLRVAFIRRSFFRTQTPKHIRSSDQ